VTTLKDALAPAFTVRLTGWVVMVGTLPTGAETLIVVVPLVTLPVRPVFCHAYSVKV
jgi:hypothetical protein